MIEKVDRMQIRCTKQEKKRMIELAKIEKQELSSYVRNAIRQHHDNLWGTVKLLQQLIPLNVAQAEFDYERKYFPSKVEL